MHSTEDRLVPASHFSGTPNPEKVRPGAGLAPGQQLGLPAPGAVAATAESELKGGRLRRQGWGWGVSSQQLGEGRRQKAAAPANCELRGGLSLLAPSLLSAFPPFFSSSLYPRNFGWRTGRGPAELDLECGHTCMRVHRAVCMCAHVCLYARVVCVHVCSRVRARVCMCVCSRWCVPLCIRACVLCVRALRVCVRAPVRVAAGARRGPLRLGRGFKAAFSAAA